MARRVKYTAKRPAKNMTSLPSHTIVPTATVLGRLMTGVLGALRAEEVVTRPLWPITFAANPTRRACRGSPRGRAVASRYDRAHVDRTHVAFRAHRPARGRRPLHRRSRVVDGAGHVGGGDARPDRGVPDRPAGQGRDGRRGRRFPRRDP